MRHSWKPRILVSYLCLSLVTAPFSAWGSASTSQGDGGSITMQAVDANGKPIPDGLLTAGQEVFIEIHAFDAQGNSIPCTNPQFVPKNGPAGNQIQPDIPIQNGRGRMTMGQSFGQAEVTGHCDNLPNVQAKMPVETGGRPLHIPGTDKLPDNVKPPETAAPAAGAETGTGMLGTPAAGGAAASAGGGGANVAALALGVGAVVGGGLLLASALKSSSSTCTPPQTACGNDGNPGSQGCCPAGYAYTCVSPSNVAGCYTTIFITGCSLKYFCTTEY